jgi:hypothetical protein
MKLILQRKFVWISDRMTFAALRTNWLQNINQLHGKFAAWQRKSGKLLNEEAGNKE